MLGNDVVDLLDSDAAPSERTPAFDARVFGPGELARIAASPDAVRERWLTWAAKEAAYKLARKLAPGTVFVPRRFEVGAPVASPRSGGGAHQRLAAPVRFPGFTCQCDWISAPDFVHALCRPAGSSLPDCLSVDRLAPGGDGLTGPDDPGGRVRRLARTEVARILGVPEGEVGFGKCEGIPYLLLGDRPLAGDISFSHHGSFVAFACRVGAEEITGEDRTQGPEATPCVASAGGSLP